jgi:hypothetical protein
MVGGNIVRRSIIRRNIVYRSIVYRRAEGDGWAKSKIRAQGEIRAEGEIRAGGTNKLAFTGNHAGRRFAILSCWAVTR